MIFNELSRVIPLTLNKRSPLPSFSIAQAFRTTDLNSFKKNKLIVQYEPEDVKFLCTLAHLD